MVTTTTAYTDARYRTLLGEGYDGVVRVSFGGYYGTGTLLFDGRAILSAAHLFEGRTGMANVTFETSWGIETRSATQVLRHPGYDIDSNNDLALVWLSSSAPTAANRYDLYRDSDELGQPFILTGYGRMGTGSTGATSSGTTTPRHPQKPPRVGNGLDAVGGNTAHGRLRQRPIDQRCPRALDLPQ
jgi:hypothetical protein